MKSIRHHRTFLATVAILAAFPAAALARSLSIPIGTAYDLQTITLRIVGFLADSITAVATAMFLVGAFMIVLSGAKEDFKQKGKDLMIGSIVSIAVVLGAYAIYRTVAAFIA